MTTYIDFLNIYTDFFKEGHDYLTCLDTCIDTTMEKHNTGEMLFKHKKSGESITTLDSFTIEDKRFDDTTKKHTIDESKSKRNEMGRFDILKINTAPPTKTVSIVKFHS